MKVKIFHANAGYGHRKVAEIIHDEFRERGIARENLAVEDALDSTPWSFKKSYPAIYFYSVKHLPNGWGWAYETLDRNLPSRIVTPFRSFGNRLVGGGLLNRVLREDPDVIICTHFFSAELFSRARRNGKLRARIVTVITDFYPHSFWVNPGTDLYWVMSKEGKKDLESRGVDKSQIVDGGIPVAKAFLPQGRRKPILDQWGFASDRFTLLMTSGSFGLGPTEQILQHLKSFSDKIQIFAVCGNNRELKDRLSREVFSFPLRIFGFVDFMPDLMEAADLLIAKSGGATTCESLAKGLPMIVLHPIPGQETRNADLLKERNAAFFMEEPQEIRTILRSIFDYPKVLTDKKVAIRGLAKPHAARDLVSYILHHYT